MSSVQSGSEDSAASGFALENLDPIGSAPLSAHKILPEDGGDDPTVPSDVALDEIVSILGETVRTQEQHQSDSEGATLDREARIELQRQTGEAFPDEDDGVGPTLDDQDANADAAMDVDDSATSVAPTEAVNPAYAMYPLRLSCRALELLQERESSSLAPSCLAIHPIWQSLRLENRILRLRSLGLPALLEAPWRALLVRLSLLGLLRKWHRNSGSNRCSSNSSAQARTQAAHTALTTAAPHDVPTPPPIPGFPNLVPPPPPPPPGSQARGCSRPPEPAGLPPGHFGLDEPELRVIPPPKPAPMPKDAGGAGQGQEQGQGQRKGRWRWTACSEQT